jgi:hypothetical protein
VPHADVRVTKSSRVRAANNFSGCADHPHPCTRNVNFTDFSLSLARRNNPTRCVMIYTSLSI